MRFELMLPHQIRTAIEKHWPVVLPLGVLEYHGEHMAVGMDTLAVTKILDMLEGEMSMVILPPFYYGAASYAVEPPEGNGSLHVDAAKLFPFAQEMFLGLLRIGFRNIHVIVHHQTENFAAGMPTDLAFKFAARQATTVVEEIEVNVGKTGALTPTAKLTPVELAGVTIPQAHPTGYPIYRLEWQEVGSLQRRLRNCMSGMRAEPYDFGAPELVDLEYFLMWRARGLAMESPAVRP